MELGQIVSLSLTGALVAITGFYAFATFRILKANRESVAVMREQTEALNRPYVTVSVMTSRERVLYLRIANTGRTAANGLQLEIDHDFWQYGDQQRNLRTMNAFTKPIHCLPPGGELIFGLAQGFVLFGEGANENITPTEFMVTAKYSYANKNVTEPTTVDLRPYLGSVPEPDPLIGEIKKIREAIEKRKV
jgi:hypothetical protein